MVNDPDGTLYVQTALERLGDRIGRTNEALIAIQSRGLGFAQVEMLARKIRGGLAGVALAAELA